MNWNSFYLATCWISIKFFIRTIPRPLDDWAGLMIHMFCSPFKSVCGNVFLNLSMISRTFRNSGYFLAMALSTASSSSSSSRSSSSSSSSSSCGVAPLPASLGVLIFLFLFFFAFDFGGRAILCSLRYFSWSFLARVFSLSSSAPSIFHSAALTSSSHPCGSSIISLRSLSRLSHTLMATLTTFSLTLVFSSPVSLYAVCLSSRTHLFRWHSAFTAMYSCAKSSCSSASARS